METAVIILGIVSLASVAALIYFVHFYTTKQEQVASDRETLINHHIADLKAQEEKFGIERDALYQKILKVNGFSPVIEEKPEQPASNGQKLTRR